MRAIKAGNVAKRWLFSQEGATCISKRFLALAPDSDATALNTSTYGLAVIGDDDLICARRRLPRCHFWCRLHKGERGKGWEKGWSEALIWRNGRGKVALNTHALALSHPSSRTVLLGRHLRIDVCDRCSVLGAADRDGTKRRPRRQLMQPHGPLPRHGPAPLHSRFIAATLPLLTTTSVIVVPVISSCGGGGGGG